MIGFPGCESMVLGKESGDVIIYSMKILGIRN